MSNTERVAKLEVRMEHLDEKVSNAQEEISTNHVEVRKDFKCLKDGQRNVEDSISAIDQKLAGHLDASISLKTARWNWLKYLIFPLLLGAAVKIFDWILP